MNRITAAGLTTEARDHAKSVLLLVHSTEVRLALDQLIASVGNPSVIERVNHANGAEAIHYASGGWIAIRATNRGDTTRAVRAKIVYIDDWRVVEDERTMEALRPVLATGCEVIR